MTAADLAPWQDTAPYRALTALPGSVSLAA